MRTRKSMKVKEWFALRGPEYVCQRAIALLKRYGVTPSQAAHQMDACMATLAKYGCTPTLFTPGRIVQRHPLFVHHLRDAGAEIAVHGYDHFDLKAYPLAVARDQLVWAAQIFEEHGIEAHGFRCPYLSCTDEILDALPKGLFDYTSNKAICWEGFASTHDSNPSLIFDTLYRFYQPRSSRQTLRVPWTHFNMVEIPVCVPDDLQLHDGLHLGPEGIAQVWNQTLHQTYRRGELFTLAFHPELASCHEQSFTVVLREARQLHPHVWITRLRDISDWWREKAGFKVGMSHTSTGLRISFSCSPRATILTRGLGSCGSACMWDGGYYRLQSRILDVPADPRPFVGLASDVPGHVVSFLQEQGYILDTGEAATQCGTYLDGDILARLTSEVDLINYIEASTSPLVRYWRWPDTAKSAMCITGDVDALTLLDYASRPFVR